MSDVSGYKLLITYNYLAGRETAYRRFMVNQWLPAMQALGLQPLDLYHTMWGDYPVRLVALYAADAATIQQALASSEWDFWLKRLTRYVTDLSYCVVPAREWFQFC